MIKLKTILFLLLSLSLLILFITAPYLYQQYELIKKSKQLNVDGSDKNSQLYKFQGLKAFLLYNFRGSSYFQRLVQKLSQRKQWDLVLEISQNALDRMTNSHSYKLWYYKALSQCALFKFQSCRKSIFQAEMRAPQNFLQKVTKIKKIFTFSYSQDLQLRRKQLETL